VVRAQREQRKQGEEALRQQAPRVQRREERRQGEALRQQAQVALRHKAQQREERRQDAALRQQEPNHAADRLLQRVEGADGKESWTFFNVSLADPMAHRKPLRSLHGWRGHRTRGQMAKDPTRRAGGGFEEVPLRAARSDRCAEFEEAASGGSGLLHDSVLLLRAMATPNECAHLARAADRFCAADVWSDVALKRVECHPDGVNLDGRSHALAHLLLSRALWYIEVLLPDLAAQLFPDAVDLADFWFKFSGQVHARSPPSPRPHTVGRAHWERRVLAPGRTPTLDAHADPPHPSTSRRRSSC
jgi:hypothetical protein